MRDYGRDYHRGGGFFERAGEKMREWFGGGPEAYDREYGGMPRQQGWTGGMRGRGYDRGTDWTGAGQGTTGWRTNNWSNTSADLESVRGAMGSYYGSDYDYDRSTYRAGGPTRTRGVEYDRDYGGTSGGYTAGGYGMGRDRQWDDTRWNRGWEGQPRMRDQEGRGGSPMGNEYFRGDRYERGGSGGMGGGYSGGSGSMGGSYGRAGYSSSMGGGGYDAGNDWGDYNQGGYGGDRFRSSSSGGVEPGRYWRGFGHGSTSGSGYEPL